MLFYFQDILKYVNKSVQESRLLFNGEIKDPEEPIKSIKEHLNKRIPQNITQSEIATDILVDLYTTCVRYLYHKCSVATLLPSPLKKLYIQHFTVQVRQLPEKSFEISDYMAELRCFGTLCSDVYLHDRAMIKDAIGVMCFLFLTGITEALH